MSNALHIEVGSWVKLPGWDWLGVGFVCSIRNPNGLRPIAVIRWTNGRIGEVAVEQLEAVDPPHDQESDVS